MARTELWIGAQPPPSRTPLRWAQLGAEPPPPSGTVAVCAAPAELDPLTGVSAVQRVLAGSSRRVDSIIVGPELLDNTDGRPLSRGTAALWRAEWAEVACRVAGPISEQMRRLNPALLPFSDADPGTYDPHLNDRQATWVASLSGRVQAPHTLVLSSRWGFDPAGLMGWWMALPPTVERAAGFAWTPDRPDVVARLDAAGTHPSVRGHGTWWVGTPSRHWPTDAAALARLKQLWHPDVGDRETRVVFIGEHLPKSELEQGFQGALMPEATQSAWQNSAMTPDPFRGQQ